MGREPERTCVGCWIKRPKRELLRIARTSDGRVEVDSGGKAPGRGAYLCRDLACAAKAAKKGTLARVLRTSLLPEDLARLRTEIERKLKA